MDYIGERVRNVVLPSLRSLAPAFRERGFPVVWIRLCGTSADRSDLHRFFASSYAEAEERGFPGIYPLDGEAMSLVAEDAPLIDGDPDFIKGGFSAFHGCGLEDYLRREGVSIIAFAGLATSQCVETSARDASDRGFSVIHVEDAQADYTDKRHAMSLATSDMVCGGWIVRSSDLASKLDAIIEIVAANEVPGHS